WSKSIIGVSGLMGCPTCNRWQAATGEWCRLAVEAVRRRPCKIIIPAAEVERTAEGELYTRVGLGTGTTKMLNSTEGAHVQNMSAFEIDEYIQATQSPQKSGLE